MFYTVILAIVLAWARRPTFKGLHNLEARVRPAERLRELRLRSSITTREVEEQSQHIAEAERNPEFYISNAWLTKLENTDSVPSIYKLVSLSAIYHVRFSELLLLFGVDLAHIGERQLEITPQQTYLMALEINDPDRQITLPVRFDQGTDLNGTNLFSRMVEQWGEVPFSVIQHLHLRHSNYGFIGLQDFTLYPLLRPGSFVQIDPRSRKIQSSRWRTEFDRPIYFLELRNSYACGWCEVQGNELALLPHPLSPCTVRRFAFPGEAEIVGRVTGVAMRLLDHQGDTDLAIAKLLRRP
jgi:transcriptional regulator with XRE-family HTH domain